MNPLAVLKAAPPAARSIPRDEIVPIYRRWRFQILSTSIIGYAAFYFVRQNIPVALPVIEKSLNLNHADMGAILTFGGVTYGVSKFVNGFIGDRANPRYFMPLGLICSAAMNVCFGLSSGLTTFAIFWLINGWFQGMGFPPCARSMANWFAPSERSSKFSLWNMGHQIGGAGIAVLTGFLVTYNWRLCFFVPAGIAAVVSVFILWGLRDSPESMGLPPVEQYHGEPPEVVHNEETSQAEFVMEYVFRKPMVWIVSIANFFVYTLRYTLYNWGPTILTQTKGTQLSSTGWLNGSWELAGMFGAILGGYAVDKFLGGKAGRVCTVATVLMAGAILCFWRTPGSSPKTYATFYIATGFLIYAPQLLVAVIAMNISTKRAAATAVGLTGIFGYASTTVSGYGVGRLVDRFGWDAAFYLMLVCCAIMFALFAITWNVGGKKK